MKCVENEQMEYMRYERRVCMIYSREIGANGSVIYLQICRQTLSANEQLYEHIVRLYLLNESENVCIYILYDVWRIFAYVERNHQQIFSAVQGLQQKVYIWSAIGFELLCLVLFFRKLFGNSYTSTSCGSLRFNTMQLIQCIVLRGFVNQHDMREVFVLVVVLVKNNVNAKMCLMRQRGFNINCVCLHTIYGCVGVMYFGSLRDILVRLSLYYDAVFVLWTVKHLLKYHHINQCIEKYKIFNLGKVHLPNKYITTKSSIDV